MRRWRWLAVLAVTGCAKVVTSGATPSVAPLPPSVAIPLGCEARFDGLWVHADDSSYQYLASDDGGTVTLVAERRFAPDAGFRPRRFFLDAGVLVIQPADPTTGPEDAGVSGPAAIIELQRTPKGFVGQTAAVVLHPSGSSCELHFTTTVTSCDGGLWVQSEAAKSVGVGCEVPLTPATATTLVHHLIRSKLGGR